MNDYERWIEDHKNAMRYEVLRKLYPQQFNELYTRNIMNNEKFDDLVDELILKHKQC